jgi:tetratricopeptide (TPR) repeat protein
MGPTGLPGNPGGMPGTNKWYFYNTLVRESGYAEFTRKWGKRKNEDNWRRSTKESAFEDIESAVNKNEGGGFFVNENGDTLKVDSDWMNPAFYMKDLPLTEEQVKASNDRIIEAYYNLAVIYKEQLEDVYKSIETLEELNNRFFPNVHTADAYYRLYRMNYDEEEMDRATYYKNKILNEYPDSQYAQIIKDPFYLERENEDYEAARRMYEKAYENYFKRGYYPQTITSCDEIIQKYPQTTIKPQAMLLRALCVGHEQGEAALRRELQVVIKEYGDTEYGEKAQQLLDGLDLKNEAAKARAEEEAKEAELAVKASTMNYEYDPESKHNFVILVKASGSELSKIKNAISDFNIKNFRMEGLKLSAVVYSSGVQMISIKSFNNAQDAMTYQQMFENSGALESIVTNNPDYFIVSYTNYALFFKSKDHENYKIWADIKYKEL